MDTSDPSAEPDESTHALVTERHRVRRPVDGRFWGAACLAVLALAAAVAFTRTDAVQDALASDVRSELKAEGLKGVKVVVDGRHVTAKVPTGTEATAVRETVGSVVGVSAVSVTEVYASRAEAKACQNIQGKLDRATKGQRILFAGESTQLTPAGQSMLREVGRLLTECGAVSVTVGGHTDRSTPNGGNVSLERARLMNRILRDAGVAAGRMEVRGYGDQFPVAEPRSAAGRVQNQRGSVVVGP
jgi:outer membrane protein OmpA-like peptidoglycan-associated protein